jgi:hypothetical protein
MIVSSIGWEKYNKHINKFNKNGIYTRTIQYTMNLECTLYCNYYVEKTYVT